MANRAARIRVFPRPEDKQKLNQLFGCYRAIYNDALQYMTANRGRVRDEGEETLQSRFSSARIKGRPNPYFERKPYLLQLKSVCRKLAVRELKDAVASNLAKRARDPGHRFNLRFKKRKLAQTLRLEAVSVTRMENGNVRLFGSEFGKEGWVTGRANRDVTFDFDCTLHRDELGRFWIHAPLARVEEADRVAAAASRGQCAIDPGVRTFLTVYDPAGGLHKLGDDCGGPYFEQLYKLDRKLGLRNRLARKLRDATVNERVRGLNPPRLGNHHRRRRLEREIRAVRAKLKNMTRDLHFKCADFLTKRYDIIALPVFETRQMSARADRTLRTKAVRAMQTSLRNSTVVLIDEAYTSKTCTLCGSLHQTLGACERFACPDCGAAYDRDGGAARNCFLKTFEQAGVQTSAAPSVAESAVECSTRASA